MRLLAFLAIKSYQYLISISSTKKKKIYWKVTSEQIHVLYRNCIAWCSHGLSDPPVPTPIRIEWRSCFSNECASEVLYVQRIIRDEKGNPRVTRTTRWVFGFGICYQRDSLKASLSWCVTNTVINTRSLMWVNGNVVSRKNQSMCLNRRIIGFRS